MFYWDRSGSENLYNFAGSKPYWVVHQQLKIKLGEP